MALADISEQSRTRRWRREWDSNPRYGFPYTRFPSVRLQPLGHLSGRAKRAQYSHGPRRDNPWNFPASRPLVNRHNEATPGGRHGTRDIALAPRHSAANHSADLAARRPAQLSYYQATLSDAEGPARAGPFARAFDAGFLGRARSPTLGSWLHPMTII